MNKVLLCGRLTKDPTITATSNGEHRIARYTIAVNRPAAREESTADFISCVAWDKKADFAEKYLKKGTKIIIEGRIQTGRYDDKDGKKVYTTDVVVESHEFCEAKTSAATSAGGENGTEWINVPDNVSDEGLPF